MTVQSPKVYSPDRVVVSLGGIPLGKGYAEDDMVKVTFNSPSFSHKVGADGTVTRAKSLDRSALVELSLMQGSAANDTCQQLLDNDRNTPGGAPATAFMLADLDGNTLVEAPVAWIEDRPEISFKKGIETRVWKIRLANAEDKQGGNNSLPGS
jgi:Protein of unknown function (DUF3277)